MIPKKIHYCWFGGNSIPEKFKTYMQSWQKYCPDFEIVRWDESNFDIECCPFVKKAYAEKKWAFVSDYARLWIIYHYGGFYLDIDVELLKPLVWLCDYSSWFACEGDSVNTGLGFGAEAHNDIVWQNLQIYEQMDFSNDASFNVHPCPYYTTEILKNYGYTPPIKERICLENSQIRGVLLLDNSYCNPYDWVSGKTKIKKHTQSIHHYAATWMSEGAKKNNIERHNYEIINEKYGKHVADIYSYLFWCRKENGGKGILKTVFNRIFK